MKKALKGALILLLVALLVVGGYVAYVLVSYHRLPDTDEAVEPAGPAVRVGETCAVVTWNLGFGAYSDDFSFFMDGGKESRARSEAAVRENIGRAADRLLAENPDFVLLQEVDTDSTRSYHVDETALIMEALDGWQGCFARNYDSAYLFYPITRPHGASKSGLLTLSKAGVTRFVRRSLPVETGVMKLLDLDRCYSVAHLPTEDGRELCLFNLHLSAYTSDGAIATEQLEMLCADMLAEAEAGNYVIAGGDFNKDLLGNSPEIFGVSGDAYNWAQPLPEGIIPDGLTLVSALDADNPVPSCRNCDIAYIPGTTFVLTVDGFIVSDNVRVEGSRVIDEGFKASDHNPVIMEFTLIDDNGGEAQ